MVMCGQSGGDESHGQPQDGDAVWVEKRKFSIQWDDLGIFCRRGDNETFQAENGKDGADDDPVNAHYSC